MSPTLTKAIETICQSRDEDSWAGLDENVLRDLINEYGERDLANRLYEEIPKAVPFEIVCDLFDLLAWRTNDNGAGVSRAIEVWLKNGIDNRQILIALHLDVYPFLDRQEMDLVLLKLANRRPYHRRISLRCKHVIAERRKLNESSR